MSETDEQATVINRSEQRYRDRQPEVPVVSLVADNYALHREATRTALAKKFAEHAAEAARRYVEMEECSRPAAWNDFTRDSESRYWMNKHMDERKAWAKALDLLRTFSDGQDVDADALREALVRMSLRRHKAGSRRDRNEEHIFVKAAEIVRETAGIDRMNEPRRKEVRGDYR